ncbi:MAG: threonylcarbamoyl-AMP synthase [Muribaculaceae bacterium]|nr:threonylcarbamoyl-AMP synthase [Muribaculaceae bacterium]
MEEDLKASLKTLREGGIILYPTDTIWGIGCDARNSEAVKKIFSIKKRADSKSMLMLLADENLIERFVDEVPDVAYQLMEAALNPLTIIYDNVSGVVPELIAEDGSAGFRVTKETFSRELCRRFRAPIVSTSANISGNPAPENFSCISDEIIKHMDYVVKFRQEEKTKASPSNIIKIGSGGLVKIIR